MKVTKSYLFLGFTFVIFVAGFMAQARNENGAVQKWRREYTLNLLSNFCTTGSYFQQCYDFDRSKCMEEVKRATSKCFEHVSVRSAKELERNHIFYGSKVGFCVGKKIEDEHRSKVKKCKDAREWM